MSVRLVQGNVPQEHQIRTRRTRTLARRLREPAAGATRATCRPHRPARVGAASCPSSSCRRAYLQALCAPTRDRGIALVFGIFIEQPESHFYNSAVGVSPSAAGAAPLQRYSKHHLVPFGEFIPPGFRWFVDLMRMPLGDFSDAARATRGRWILPASASR